MIGGVRGGRKITHKLRLRHAAGHKIVDVLDMHYYPEAQGGGVRVTSGTNNTAAVVAARVQAVRSLWDPNYGYNASDPTLGENSWITQYSTGGQAIQLLNREATLINTYNPGTKLAFTEYQFGGGDHISGGIAKTLASCPLAHYTESDRRLAPPASLPAAPTG